MIPTVLLILLGTAALGVANMPDALRWCAARLLARAEGIVAQRATRTLALAHWERVFAISRED